ncbi:MAG: DUF2953 domain-containing protein [Bacillota bacterium]|jgi:hypothetical protein|nr:DUF2953 domain-containing protein [Candidatus Fermentithermobacillaceae bacterium]
MSGLGAVKYIPHVMLGTALVGALVASTPARFKVDFLHNSGTTVITVSIKPLFVPGYIIVFKQTRKTQVSGPGEALVQWVCSLIESRVGAKHRKKRADDGKGPRRGKHSYRDLVREARRIMAIEEVSVRGQIGFDDACTTSLVCGALMALGGTLLTPQSGRKHWKASVLPVYHRRCFELKAKLVVRVSLLNAIRLLIFSKQLLKR